MNHSIRAPLSLAFLLIVALVQNTFSQDSLALAIRPGPRVQPLVDRAVKRSLEEFAAKKLVTNELAVTLVDLRDPNKPAQGSYRGGEQVYPASTKRDPFDPKAETQSRESVGKALPGGAKLWSKAGWTSETRHDAAGVELPNGNRFVLVVFTVNHANDKEIISVVTRAVIEGFTG